jgi:hypothetical protein
VHHSAILEKAVAHALGSTFICVDAGVAKTVAFARDTGGARCVTLLDDHLHEPGSSLADGKPLAGGRTAPAHTGANAMDRRFCEAES